MTPPPPLLGHEPTLRRLAAAFERGRLAHALVFSGPDGVGKSRAARTFAARVLCAAGPAAPCGACADCIQVAAGTHPDVVLVQLPAGKKEIGVDLVRALKRAVQITAVCGRGKVAIIDDADRLTLAAQNALLKTLEEPPPQVFIVLVTASPGGLLSTVRSRSQRILFQPLGETDVATILREQHGIAAAEADALAARAEGSPGRALRMRELWGDNEHTTLLNWLADLDPARYVSVLRMSKALGGTEPETAARLELLLSSYRDAVVHAVVDPPPSGIDLRATDRAVRGGELVAEAIRTLRRRNPNRTLLLEALALRLARA